MSRILFKDSTQAREDRVQKKQDFPAANSSMEGGSYRVSAPPTVGSQTELGGGPQVHSYLEVT